GAVVKKLALMNGFNGDAAGFFPRDRAAHAIRDDGDHEFIICPQAHIDFVIFAYLTNAGMRAAAETRFVIRPTHAVSLRKKSCFYSTEAASFGKRRAAVSACRFSSGYTKLPFQYTPIKAGY